MDKTWKLLANNEHKNETKNSDFIAWLNKRTRSWTNHNLFKIQHHYQLFTNNSDQTRNTSLKSLALERNYIIRENKYNSALSQKTGEKKESHENE